MDRLALCIYTLGGLALYQSVFFFLVETNLAISHIKDVSFAILAPIAEASVPCQRFLAAPLIISYTETSKREKFKNKISCASQFV